VSLSRQRCRRGNPPTTTTILGGDQRTFIGKTRGVHPGRRTVGLPAGVNWLHHPDPQHGETILQALSGITNVSNIAHVIQLAVAPVFLLTGVGAILSVLVNRLGRVVDRFRALEYGLPEVRESALAAAQTEMSTLSRRARMIHWAIGLCTGCALLVCVVIGTLFVGSMIEAEMPGTIAMLFIAAMLSLVAGLLCFLREIALATGGIHVMPR
jgi:hypothetical protein